MFPPVIRSRSLRLRGIAWTLIRNSPGPGSGIDTSSSVSTSNGCPYVCVRHARITPSRPAICLSVSLLATHRYWIVLLLRTLRDGLVWDVEELLVRARSLAQRTGIEACVGEGVAVPAVLLLRILGEEPVHGAVSLGREVDPEAVVNRVHHGHRIGQELPKEHVHSLPARDGTVAASLNGPVETKDDVVDPLGSDRTNGNLVASQATKEVD